MLRARSGRRLLQAALRQPAESAAPLAHTAAALWGAPAPLPDQALLVPAWCRQHATRMGPPVTKLAMPGVQHIVAVASGKGGVGKSTCAVNLAVALARQGSAAGRRVGLMDADVFGPSVPRMLGLAGRPKPGAGGKMTPLEGHGVHAISMGFLLEEDAAAVWRGPMVMSALQTFMTKVDWGPLDVLVIDMPPGTGDAQLTITQRLPLSGAVIVSTPQDIALMDARRGATMFRKVDTPILGIIENMSYYQCSACGHRDPIFGEGGAARTAQEMDMELLGQIPLQTTIRQASDDGQPVVVSAPNSPAAGVYNSIALRLCEKLGLHGAS